MRLNMKSFTRLAVCAITIATVSIISCKKGDTGPAGPAGPAGAQGAQGVQGVAGPSGQSGNANVMQYIYFADASGIDLTGPAPNQNKFGLLIDASNDTLENCAWFMYLHRDGAWFGIPGAGEGDTSTYSFFYGYISNALDTAIFLASRTSGPGEVFDAMKVVRILVSGTVTNSTGGSGNRRGLPNIDFSNYEEVKKYYNLQ